MNMQSIMAQAQKMQKEITKKKEEIDKQTFTGSSEWVTIEINGKKEVLKVKINYDNTIEQDDKEMLEDMIKIAYNKALASVEKEIENKLGAYSSSVGGFF